jgi:catechol 2,3-dioxygenase
MAPERLPDAARLGPVHLVVTDLERSLAFYEGVIGLRVHAGGYAAASLGTGGGAAMVLH